MKQVILCGLRKYQPDSTIMSTTGMLASSRPIRTRHVWLKPARCLASAASAVLLKRGIVMRRDFLI